MTVNSGNSRDIAITYGKPAGILSAGLLSGLILGLILAAIDRQAGPITVVLTMIPFGLLMAFLNRLFTSRGRFFTFYSSVQHSFSIGWDWFVSVFIAPIALAVIFPDLSSVLWRFPPSFILIGPLLYALWLYPYRSMVLKFSGLERSRMIVLMAETALNFELGRDNNIDITLDTDGVLHLKGTVSDRDRHKDARQAVVGIPDIKDIDTSELKIRARM